MYNLQIYKMTLDLQRLFESYRLPFLKSCVGVESHSYSTRKAIGKLATPSKKRATSVSSSESISSSLVAHDAPSQRRYPKREVSKSSRYQMRSTSHDYRAWSNGEEQESIVDEEEEEEDVRGRSISVDASISSEDLQALPSSSPRRQTRSMAKKRTVRSGGAGRDKWRVARVAHSEENGFGMTLRKRGTKRSLEEDSGSDEESDSEVEENQQREDESGSENESLDVEQEESEEEEEEEEDERERQAVRSPRKRPGRPRSQGMSKSQRKRQRMSSDSDEDLTYKPSKSKFVITRSSRSGRLVKANTKYS